MSDPASKVMELRMMRCAYISKLATTEYTGKVDFDRSLFLALLSSTDDTMMSGLFVRPDRSILCRFSTYVVATAFRGIMYYTMLLLQVCSYLLVVQHCSTFVGTRSSSRCYSMCTNRQPTSQPLQNPSCLACFFFVMCTVRRAAVQCSAKLLLHSTIVQNYTT